MKTFKEYLSESKKVYSFKIKVAGEIPEDFENNLKERLEKSKVITFEKISTTPIQKTPLDFPGLTNKEVTVYEVVLEYPITSPQIVEEIKSIGMTEDCVRVRGSGEPSEIDQIGLTEEPKEKEALLKDPMYKESTNADHKDYFGADFNKGFLKDLETAAKARKKELGHDKIKPGSMPSTQKIKTDKSGIKSPVGSR